MDVHSGRTLVSTVADLAVAARGAATVPVPPDVATPTDPRAELLVAQAPGAARALWWYAEDVDPPPDYSVAVHDGRHVTVTAHTLLRDVALFPDRLDPAAEVDDALVTLLPGESVTFSVRGGGPLDPAALGAPPVLRCAGDLFTPPAGTPPAR